MKRLCLTLLLLAVACVGARGQDTAEKRQDIKRLLELNGAGRASVQIFEQMLPNIRMVFDALLQDLPEGKRARAVQIMEEEMRRSFTAERVIEGLVPIYDKFLTSEEVKALIAFFESPAGKKFVAVQPLLIREGSAMGDSIAEEAIGRIYVKYMAEGIDVPPPSGREAAPPPPPRRRRRR